MTESAEPNKSAPISLPEALAAIVERATEAGIETEVRHLSRASSPRARFYVLLEIPNGRRTRQVAVFPNNFEAFRATEFENFIVLGDYVAIVDKRSGRIEAQISGGGGPGRGLAGRFIQQLPGVESIADGDSESDAEVFEEEVAPAGSLPSKNWRLVVEREGVTIEVSPASAEFDTFLEGGTTVKIVGVSTSSHDAALEALERYAGAMLFDMDLVYGIPVQLSKRRRGNRPRRRELIDQLPKFPRNQYAGQALELYQYGRSAAGLPLLEYLAYYQSVEYFFPFFAREQTVNSVRTQLLHPGFDASNDVALNRLISLAAPAARGGMAEREQLRATIRACMDEEGLSEFINSLPEYLDHFCSKSQTIKGVSAIQLNGNHSDLRDQIADRIYAIRCRIVHSKQDGGGTSDEVLLPWSNEADSLQADLELLRLVAQRALIARAARA